MENKNTIHCTVKSCAYNHDFDCAAKTVNVGLNNATHADRESETSCKTFKINK